MRPKTIIVEKSSYRRQLELLDELDHVLAACADYKSMQKFANLASERYYFYTQPSRTQYLGTPVRFHFERKNNRDEWAKIEFDMADKSIPTIRAASIQHREKLEGWIETENEKTFSAYQTEREIENALTGEFTRAQFIAKRAAIVSELHRLALEVQAYEA